MASNAAHFASNKSAWPETQRIWPQTYLHGPKRSAFCLKQICMAPNAAHFAPTQLHGLKRSAFCSKHICTALNAAHFAPNTLAWPQTQRILPQTHPHGPKRSADCPKTVVRSTKAAQIRTQSGRFTRHQLRFAKLAPEKTPNTVHFTSKHAASLNKTPSL